MKFLIVLMLSITLLFSAETDVDIKANNFSADKSKNIIIFTGQVSMIKGSDTLYCDKLVVHTNNSGNGNKTDIQSYIATGHVNIKLKRPDTLMIGKGDQIRFNVDTMIYEIIGNGYLEDTVGQKIIKGEKIHYDAKNENTNIDGGKNKPVQFKFKMEAN